MTKLPIALAAIVLIAIGAGVYFFTRDTAPAVPTDVVTAPTDSATTTPQDTIDGPHVIGQSVEGRSITAHTYGTGNNHLLFIAGLHGGYEWNTVLLAYDIMDYLEANPEKIPANVRVTVIPVANPDGLNKTVGTAERFSVNDVPPAAETVSGRFNANNVDLNRNFDCDWQTSATWQNKTVSGGTAAFSEPEARALRDYITANPPRAAVVWYSSAGGVYASNCHDGVLPETSTLVDVYADASGYPGHENFDFYEITGDMVNWLAKEKIPAISVLLTNHTDTESAKNRAGVDAIIQEYAE